MSEPASKAEFLASFHQISSSYYCSVFRFALTVLTTLTTPVIYFHVFDYLRLLSLYLRCYRSFHKIYFLVNGIFCILKNV